MTRSGSDSGRNISAGGRIAGTLFFFVFLAMGMVFCAVISREFWFGLQTHRWTSVPCEVLESRVEREATGEIPYRLLVRFAYQWEGRTLVGSKYRRDPGNFSSYEDAHDVAARFAAGANAVCMVNPADPEEAILEKSSLWIGVAIFIPLIFVGVGSVGIWAMWIGRSKASEPSPTALSSRPQLRDRTAKTGWAISCVVAGVVTMAGLVAAYFMVVRPLAGIISARSWQPVTCTILSSQVQRHRGSDSTTYSVDIFYEYEFNGRIHQSSRYKFMPGSTGGYSAKADVVNRYPKGSQAICYVDPHRPSRAVLERGATPDLWFGLIPILFTIGGVSGFIVLRRRALVQLSPASDIVASAMTSSPRSAAGRRTFGSKYSDFGGSEPRELKSSNSRIAAVVGIGLFAAFWNGVIYFGFIRSMKFFARGSGDFFDWFQLLFMLPFVAAGLGLILWLGYLLLALFNPKVTVRLVPGAPALGGRLTLDWQLEGRVERLRGLEIFLEGREEARYRRGTSTYTDRKTFLKLPVHSATDGPVLATGQGSVLLPMRSMPSFDSGNNKIVWAVHVKGRIPRWPDLKEEFVIQVQPPETIIRHERPEDSAA